MKIGVLVGVLVASLVLTACERGDDGADDAADGGSEDVVRAGDAPAGAASISSEPDEDGSPSSGASATVEEEAAPDPNPNGFGLAPFAGDWAADVAACMTDAVYELRERLVFTPTERCVLISGNTAPELEAAGGDGSPVEVKIYCEAGREGVPLLIGWPVPEPDRTETWRVEAVGAAAPATSLRLDRGDGRPIDLIHCGR